MVLDTRTYSSIYLSIHLGLYLHLCIFSIERIISLLIYHAIYFSTYTYLFFVPHVLSCPQNTRVNVCPGKNAAVCWEREEIKETKELEKENMNEERVCDGVRRIEEEQAKVKGEVSEVSESRQQHSRKSTALNDLGAGKLGEGRRYSGGGCLWCYFEPSKAPGNWRTANYGAVQ